MPVDILGDRDARVPEDIGDHMQRRPLSEHQRGSGVPEFVWVPVAEPRLLGQLGEQVREGVRVGRVAEKRRKDQAVFGPLSAGLEAFRVVPDLVALESVDEFGGKRQNRVRCQ
jgi:hypothetical protein